MTLPPEPRPPVHVVVPEGIDDPRRPSGGNVYDRRVVEELVALGRTVHEHAVPGGWPHPDRAALAALARVLDTVPDGAVVLVDGLVASPSPVVLVPRSGRLRLVVLLHMPLGDARERAVVSAAHAVVTPSRWARRRVVQQHGVPAGAVHVAVPGIDPAPAATGSRAGGRLLCVAAVVPDKGHDVLVEALGRLGRSRWRCRLVGATDLDPAYVAWLRTRVRAAGLGGRVLFTGPLTRHRLGMVASASDLVVTASRRESYGMAVAEGLARGLPVVATDVGGLPEAVGQAPDGSRPGLLVPPDDPGALADGLARWLGDAGLRERLRRAARRRGEDLGTWTDTARQVDRVLSFSGVTP